MTCTICKKEGHNARSCPNSGETGNKTPIPGETGNKDVISGEPGNKDSITGVPGNEDVISGEPGNKDAISGDGSSSKKRSSTEPTNSSNKRKWNIKEKGVDVTCETIISDMQRWETQPNALITDAEGFVKKNHSFKGTKETVEPDYIRMMISLYQLSLHAKAIKTKYQDCYTVQDFVEKILTDAKIDFKKKKPTAFYNDMKSGVAYLALVETGYPLKHFPKPTIAYHMAKLTGRTDGASRKEKISTWKDGQIFTTELIPELWDDMCTFYGCQPSEKETKDYIKKHFVRGDDDGESLNEEEGNDAKTTRKTKQEIIDEQHLKIAKLEHDVQILEEDNRQLRSENTEMRYRLYGGN